MIIELTGTLTVADLKRLLDPNCCRCIEGMIIELTVTLTVADLKRVCY
jgi:hypothetical protein